MAIHLSTFKANPSNEVGFSTSLSMLLLKHNIMLELGEANPNVKRFQLIKYRQYVDLLSGLTSMETMDNGRLFLQIDTKSEGPLRTKAAFYIEWEIENDTISVQIEGDDEEDGPRIIQIDDIISILVDLA